MTALTHHGLYRNAPLLIGGLLGSIALLAAGVAAALHIATTGDELLPLVFGTLGLFVLSAAVFMLAALRRHCWTVDAQALLIEERPLVPLTGRRRARRVPFGKIAALSNVQNAVDDLLTLTTRDGERFVLPPGLASGEGLIRAPDQAALARSPACCRRQSPRQARRRTAGRRRPRILEPSARAGLVRHRLAGKPGAGHHCLVGPVGRCHRPPPRRRGCGHPRDAAGGRGLDAAPVLAAPSLRAAGRSELVVYEYRPKEPQLP